VRFSTVLLVVFEGLGLIVLELELWGVVREGVVVGEFRGDEREPVLEDASYGVGVEVPVVCGAFECLGYGVLTVVEGEFEHLAEVMPVEAFHAGLEALEEGLCVWEAAEELPVRLGGLPRRPAAYGVVVLVVEDESAGEVGLSVSGDEESLPVEDFDDARVNAYGDGAGVSDEVSGDGVSGAIDGNETVVGDRSKFGAVGGKGGLPEASG